MFGFALQTARVSVKNCQKVICEAVTDKNCKSNLVTIISLKATIVFFVFVIFFWHQKSDNGKNKTNKINSFKVYKSQEILIKHTGHFLTANLGLSEIFIENNLLDTLPKWQKKNVVFVKSSPKVAQNFQTEK